MLSNMSMLRETLDEVLVSGFDFELHQELSSTLDSSLFDGLILTGPIWSVRDALRRLHTVDGSWEERWTIIWPAEWMC